jgi:hypothetical protein
VTRGTHLFGLSNVSQAGLEPVVAAVAGLEPSSFLSVMCCGEAFHRLGVQDVEDLIMIGALFTPSVTPTSQGGFGVTELRLSASIP